MNHLILGHGRGAMAIVTTGLSLRTIKQPETFLCWLLRLLIAERWGWVAIYCKGGTLVAMQLPRAPLFIPLRPPPSPPPSPIHLSAWRVVLCSAGGIGDGHVYAWVELEYVNMYIHSYVLHKSAVSAW